MNKLLSREFITYCLVGLVNTVVGIGTALIFLNVIFPIYEVPSHISYPVSTGLSYVVGIIVSFYLNKKFTFKNTDKAGMQFVKFFTTMLPAYVFSYWLGYNLGHFTSRFLPDFIFDFFAKLLNVQTSVVVDDYAVLISMAIYLIAGFSINKFIVFKQNQKPSKL